MTSDSMVMREIYEIRNKLYEETKNMTPEEHTAFYRRKAEEVAHKYGITLKRPLPSKSDTAAR